MNYVDGWMVSGRVSDKTVTRSDIDTLIEKIANNQLGHTRLDLS